VSTSVVNLCLDKFLLAEPIANRSRASDIAQSWPFSSDRLHWELCLSKEGNNDILAPLALAEMIFRHGICVLTVGNWKKWPFNHGN